MSLLKNVWADLVEKRLWPLAVVLGVALVAVPVVLARGGSSAPAAPPLPAPAPTSAAAATQRAAVPIHVVAPAPAKRAPHGGYHDPFAGSAPKAATSSSPAPSTGSASSASSSSSASASSPASSSPSSSSGSSSSAPSSVSSSPAGSPTSSTRTSPSTPSGYAAGYRLDVDFGPAGSTHANKDVTRLKPLAANTKPLAIYIGVRKDGKTAMFLLTRTATATGDGKCWPTKVACQLLELRKGDSEFFDVPTGSSGVVQYELDVNHVSPRYSATHTAAVKARKRESKAGRKAMMEIVASGRTYVTRLVYSSVRGVLLPQHIGTLTS